MFGSLIRRNLVRLPDGDDAAFGSTTFSLTTAVPRPTERRGDNRLHSTLCIVKLKANDGEQLMRARNVSAGGLMAEIGRPVAVDAHPKHAIALGAALAAAGTEEVDEVVAQVVSDEEATMAATKAERIEEPTVVEEPTRVAEKAPAFVRTEPAPPRAEAQMSMPLLVVSAILAIGAVGALIFRLVA